MPEDRHEAWAQPHRDVLRGRRTELALAAAAAAGEQCRHRHVVEMLLPILAEDELDEPVARALMRALAAEGRRSEALMVFERLRDEIGREYGGLPDPRTRRLYRDLLAGSAEDADGVLEPSPSREPGSGLHNLPVAVSALIGRGDELEETAAVLEQTRLLTITGPGGAGKTRLATELARRRPGRHPDGVWLVELAVLSRGDLLAHQVAGALGLTLPERGAPLPALVRQLGGRRLMLVLDNCEHLVDPCARLVHEVLRRCRGVVVLATSREPLRVDGEVAWRIPSLAVPGPGATARQLSRVAAARHGSARSVALDHRPADQRAQTFAPSGGLRRAGRLGAANRKCGPARADLVHYLRQSDVRARLLGPPLTSAAQRADVGVTRGRGERAPG
ncbi:ATP-binding protein [Pseudonocardia sp. RS010]|uniref:ATP-binding protein n=1 Tax=Pseudonocardia sp. RS010 TaxID=3385979 RepID=UPI00399FAEC9